MFQVPDDLRSRIARRHGVVTRAELLAASVSIDQIRRAVTAGMIERRHAGVYRFTVAQLTFEARCIAACLADPDAIVTGAAAARLWDFRHVFRPDQPVIAVPHDRTPLSTGVVLRRSNVLDRADWTLRPDEIRVATPARAWFDCARDLDDTRFEKLTEWVLDRHETVPTLWAMRRRLNQRGRPGLARVNRVLSQRQAWQKPAGSGLEVEVIRGLARRGVVGLVRQHPIRLPDGSVVHPDAAVPTIRWAIEVDHVTWHGGRFDAQRDKGRDRKLRRVRWQVDRITDQELRDHAEAAIDELAELYHLRRLDLAA